MPATSASATICPALTVNASRTNTISRDDVGADEQALPREAVDERPEQEPDRDRRQEVGDQQRADPHAGVRPVLDVDAERDDREARPEPRDQGTNRRGAGSSGTQRSTSRWRARKGGTRRDVSAPGARSRTRASASGEERVLVGRARSDPDRRRRDPNPCSGRTITPSASSASKSGLRVGAGLGVEEVGDRRPGGREARPRRGSPRAGRATPTFSAPAAGDLVRRRRGSRAPPPARRSRRRTRA